MTVEKVDIVRRLREARGWAPVALYGEAADEIERLRTLLFDKGFEWEPDLDSD